MEQNRFSDDERDDDDDVAAMVSEALTCAHQAHFQPPTWTYTMRRAPAGPASQKASGKLEPTWLQRRYLQAW